MKTSVPQSNRYFQLRKNLNDAKEIRTSKQKVKLVRVKPDFLAQLKIRCYGLSNEHSTNKTQLVVFRKQLS